MDEPVILHITTAQALQSAIAAGEYRTPELPSLRFMHFCRPSQLSFVLSKFFPDRTGLVVLYVTSAKLRAPLVFEPSEPDQLPFPHLYGPLNLDAVEKVEVL